MRKIWSRDEHILALNLYFQIPFGKINKGHSQVIELAKLLGRTPSSVSMKLGNFGRHDPVLKARGVTGLTRGAKGEETVWEEFNNNPEDIAFESEKLRAKFLKKSVEEINNIILDDSTQKEGKERDAVVKVRVNQSLFRRRILSAYNYRCNVTGMNMPNLLVAGHILTWAESPENRLNPFNGLSLNRIHDKLFEDGLMWIDQNYTIKYSEELLANDPLSKDTLGWLRAFENKPLIFTDKIKPSLEFLHMHARKHKRVF